MAKGEGRVPDREVGTFRRRRRPDGRGGLSAFMDEGAVEEGVLFEDHCRMTPAPCAEVPAGRNASVIPLKR